MYTYSVNESLKLRTDKPLEMRTCLELSSRVLKGSDFVFLYSMQYAEF